MTEQHVTADDSERTPPPLDHQAHRRTQRRRALVSSMLGNVVEYYDFAIYSTAASLVFGKVFFPTSDSVTGTVNTFGTLAVGYLARPLGGVLFGHLGDRIGRKIALLITLVAMAGATLLIGLLPGYARIGLWAPILLIVLRLIQGLAVGGEWGGAVIMSVEHAGARRRGLMGSLTQSGGSLALLLSFGAFSLLDGLDERTFLSWGWRLPFLVTIVMLGIGLYLRLKVEESPVLEAACDGGERTVKPRTPLWDAVRDRPRALLLGIGLGLGPFAAYSVLTTFALSYASGQLGLPRQLTITALMISSGGLALGIPLFAALSDRIGRRPIYRVAILLMMVNAFVVFQLIQTRQAAAIIIGFVISVSVLHAATIGLLPAILPELFPTRYRYTAVSVAYQLTSAVSGGLTPLFAALLTGPGGPGIIAVSVMMAALCAVSAGCALALRETRDVDLVNA
ncbi:MFS transporter [Amycolatopsis thermoflava]|uniref:Putative proline/betaine transporter n=1 Tax=Amycolatopsis thermoflava TaxID=84480 RepID=A0A3N2GPD4_9PSEU|nr:MFS transporter [Amycolatopsis thermoflava]ROS38451.1 MFS transporter [Amycolatopsis thermoflava]